MQKSKLEGSDASDEEFVLRNTLNYLIKETLCWNIYNTNEFEM